MSTDRSQHVSLLQIIDSEKTKGHQKINGNHTASTGDDPNRCKFDFNTSAAGLFSQPISTYTCEMVTLKKGWGNSVCLFHFLFCFYMPVQSKCYCMCVWSHGIDTCSETPVNFDSITVIIMLLNKCLRFTCLSPFPVVNGASQAQPFEDQRGTDVYKWRINLCRFILR